MGGALQECSPHPQSCWLLTRPLGAPPRKSAREEAHDLLGDGFAAITAERRAAIGLSDAMVRISVGVEDVADLEDDLRQAIG